MYRVQIREDIRTSIMDACLRTIAKYGIVNTTLAKIAQEAKMSKGRLFYYYTAKKSILDDIIGRYETQVLQSRDSIYAEMP